MVRHRSAYQPLARWFCHHRTKRAVPRRGRASLPRTRGIPVVTNQPTDVVFETDGLTYRGLAWGDTGKPLVFAIHGWLDNALSFAVLAPLLTHYRVISIDLSGHGLSSHRSADANYHIWDDIPQLMAVIDQLGVSGAHIVGHSRGAAVAGMLAVALNERCLSLTMLDGMISRSFENDDGAELFLSLIHI